MENDYSNMSNLNTLTETEARQQGYHPLAGPYEAHEKLWLNRVISDMKQGAIDFVIVMENFKNIFGPSVWRR